MQTSKILSASLIDLIFEGHNKEYGAYELRKNYSKRISSALVFTLTLAGLICATVIIASTAQKNNIIQDNRPDVVLKGIEEEKIKPPEPDKQKEIKPVKTVANTIPLIKPNEEVDETPPTQEDILSAVTGTEDIEGPADDGTVKEPGELDGGKGIVEQRPEPESDEPFRDVQVPASYPGDWVRFLTRTLNANLPVDNGAPPGRYSVVVEFVVDKQGEVSDIKTLTNHGFGMEGEAIRAIKKAGNWNPAIQNGHEVKAYKRQVIVFEINEE